MYAFNKLPRGSCTLLPPAVLTANPTNRVLLRIADSCNHTLQMIFWALGLDHR